jgi:cytochrome c oxidase cbb3-type subunit 4
VDINDLRSIFTVLTFLMFIGIVAWAYSGHRKAAYEEAAMLPLIDDEPFGDAQARRNDERNA